MDNKSELSKPVAWAFKDANDVEHASIIKKANLYGRHDFQPLYSQEYVSALLAELERYKQYAKERDAENESLALTVGRLRVELEAK
ncbi:TPA: ead/Ea22-like family protein, partial [Serratia marcescens]